MLSRRTRYDLSPNALTVARWAAGANAPNENSAPPPPAGRTAFGQGTDGLPQHCDLVLLRGGVVDQAAHGKTQRVVVLRHAIGGKSHFRGCCLAFGIGMGLDDACRVANRSGAGRHRLGDHGVGADLGTIADREAAQHLRAGADDHILANRRMALGTLVQRRAAQRDAVVDRAAVADLGGLADHHTHGMVEEHALADFGAGMDLDAGEPACNMRGETPQPGEAVVPEPVRRPVQDERVQARITGQDLPGAARGRITVEDALDIGAKTGEHGLKSSVCRRRLSRAWPWRHL